MCFSVCQPNSRSLLSVIILVSLGSKCHSSLWSLSHNIKFEVFPPSSQTDHGRSCAAAAGGGCFLGRCQPEWYPVRCVGWAFRSWPGWGLVTCPWAWAPASRGESKDPAVSGLWSFPCICGSRWRTWMRPAFCRRESAEGTMKTACRELHRGQSVAEGLTSSGGTWCAVCIGEPPPPPRWWWRLPLRWR